MGVFCRTFPQIVYNEVGMHARHLMDVISETVGIDRPSVNHHIRLNDAGTLFEHLAYNLEVDGAFWDQSHATEK
jgi:hypothetical protein